VAAVPRHARLIEHEIAAARARGESVVVLVHGGDEYRREVNDDQLRWSRWLVARGARLLAGSGPHVVQREEAHGGAVVVHSLGNAVFPKKLKGADGGRIGEWTVPGTPRPTE
jgi:poly-gamma-glutamate synthesis protein (capsule biosynthesis protein)